MDAGGRATQEAKAEGGPGNNGCRVGESILDRDVLKSITR